MDLSKAYNKTNWLYLRLILIHVGFNLFVVNWIMSCVSSVNFSLLINGVASNFFKPTRGLRKGCPLSPLLFLLVVEGISRIVMEAKRRGILQGIKIGSILLTHLLFVDDIYVFLNGTERESIKVKEILILCMAIGMEVNVQKSLI
jgi:hypothetical protein